MKNYKNICILILLILICLGNAFASIDVNKLKYLNSERYKLCQSDSDADNQSDIYQEPSQEGDENAPADSIIQPDEIQDDTETN